MVRGGYKEILERCQWADLIVNEKQLLKKEEVQKSDKQKDTTIEELKAENARLKSEARNEFKALLTEVGGEESWQQKGRRVKGPQSYRDAAADGKNAGKGKGKNAKNTKGFDKKGSSKGKGGGRGAGKK